MCVHASWKTNFTEKILLSCFHDFSALLDGENLGYYGQFGEHYSLSWTGTESYKFRQVLVLVRIFNLTSLAYQPILLCFNLFICIIKNQHISVSKGAIWNRSPIYISTTLIYSESTIGQM